MENPNTHNEPTKIIGEALRKAQKNLDNKMIGLSLERQIHDALKRAGWIRSPEEQFDAALKEFSETLKRAESVADDDFKGLVECFDLDSADIGELRKMAETNPAHAEEIERLIEAITSKNEK